jgi:hypothetical protein
VSDRANERTGAHQLSRHDRPQDPPNPYDPGRDRRRLINDRAAGSDRSALSDAGFIHVFLNNARYHHANLVQQWLAYPGLSDKAPFHPGLLFTLEPDRVMHRQTTHNKRYATDKEFANAMLDFLREKVPKHWPNFRDSVTDNFRAISPRNFRGMM